MVTAKLCLLGSLSVNRTKESLDGQDLASRMGVLVLGIVHFSHIDRYCLGRLTGDSQTHVDRRIHRLPPEKDGVGMLDRAKEDNSSPTLSISVFHEVHI